VIRIRNPHPHRLLVGRSACSHVVPDLFVLETLILQREIRELRNLDLRLREQ
jgi:hypothetical protein